ncbi:MAG: hypothetical protein KKC75_03145 [Nanoarchaeota archaeon]|nr:hypothetical protein [Nanoarchaeota archaeon]MBU1004791.1 hypothetical protein [Nanoarchaeota archaeon]MBU1945539.1 hypothetical protein [Nanoarchaeota archaeon]
MTIVIDSNRIVAALLKDNTTRNILFNNKFEFIAPEFVKTELNKHRQEFIEKAGISSKEFEVLLSLIFESVTLIPKEEYNDFIDGLKAEISDPKDIPYLACCIAANSEGIWSHDPHIKEQNKVKVFTNIDLLRTIRS